MYVLAGTTPQQALRFRRLEYTGHPAQFWNNLLAPAAQGGKKAMMQLKRAEVPAGTPPQHQAAASVEAAMKSVDAFMSFVETLRSNPASPAAGKIMALEMKHVGIKCEGRSGPYDLLYFPHCNKIIAADSSDDSIVYSLA